MLFALLLVGWGGLALAQPLAGGVLKSFLYDDPPTFDLHAEASLATLQATAGLYGRLVRPPEQPAGPPESYRPDLAIRWTVSASGREVAFDLRREVFWHDRRPFGAADVIATFDRILNPAFDSPRCGAMVRPLLREVVARGSHRAVFRLRFATPALFPALASGWCGIVAAHILERDGNLASAASQVGTGPFRLKAYRPGASVEWERNPGYYEAGQPVLAGVRLLVLPGLSRQIAAALAGEIDLWGGWPPIPRGRVPALRRKLDGHGRLVSAPRNIAWTVVFNTRRPPFDKPQLRRAVSLALDRRELFEQAFAGEGSPCAILDPAIYGPYALPAAELETLPGCRYPKTDDLAEARRLVAENHPRGLEIEVAVRLAGDYVRRSGLVAAALERIGIKSTIKAYESAAGYRAFRRGRFTLIAAQDAVVPVADPGAPFALLFGAGALRNWGHWQDSIFHDLSQKALQARKREDRIAAYHEMQRYLLTEDTGAVIVGWLRHWGLRAAAVKNYRPGPTLFDRFDLRGVWLAR